LTNFKAQTHTHTGLYIAHVKADAGIRVNDIHASSLKKKKKKKKKVQTVVLSPEISYQG